MSKHPGSSHSSWEALLSTVQALSADDKRRLWETLNAEFGVAPSERPQTDQDLHEARSEYLVGNHEQVQGDSVRISFQASPLLAGNLQAFAQERRISIDFILNELLSTSLAILQVDPWPNEDMDSLAVRRELAAASVAALGDFWDDAVLP